MITTPARPDHWQQIGQRLSCASASFHDQVAFFFQRLLDRLRHLQLPAPKFVRRVRAGQNSAGGEELVERSVTCRLVLAGFGEAGDAGWERRGTEVSIIAIPENFDLSGMERSQ